MQTDSLMQPRKEMNKIINTSTKQKAIIFGRLLLCIVFALTVVSCQNKPESVAAMATLIPSMTFTPKTTSTPEISTMTPTVTNTPVLTSKVCSPLSNFSLSDISNILTNSMKTPSPGKDDGHQGVDFSFWSYGKWKSIEGLEISSALDGIVAGVVYDRFPYGNMIMIETPLEQLPVALQQELNSLPESPTPDLAYSPLTCPAISPSDFPSQQKSLYLLYAHMLEPSTHQSGDVITCGENLGQVGNTGDSSNAHLHFEVRIGPSGFRFTEMAHYLNDLTETERYNYCTWRVSGIFQLVDPMEVLSVGLP
jgi:murein DD-endopeptidase MepM/ murein hydrolase activator NlpD